MQRSRRPRLVDLATLLDLSPSTVSRALSGSPSISPETRARVEAAARDTGYSVNPAASGLKRGSTLNLGLVAVMNHWYSGAVATGADHVAAQNGYDFVVANADGGNRGEIDLDRARRLGARVDGALVVDISPDDGRLSRLIDALAVPVVTMGCAHAGVSSVEVDNFEVGARAARHLIDQGVDDAVVAMLEPPNPAAVNNGSARADGFAAVLPPERVVGLSRRDRASRQRDILDAVERPGLFCTSDALAIEVVSLLRQAGRDVPGDVAVIGVDDHPLAQPVGLTTMAQDPEAMGSTAVELLLEAIDGKPVRRVEATVELVVRQTTARANA